MLRTGLSALVSVEGAVGLAVCGLLIILAADLPSRFVAAAVLKVDFVTTNSAVLAPEQYGTNAFGWAPLLTEERMACSDRVAGKALALSQSQSGSTKGGPARPKLEAKVVRQGLRLRVWDEDAERASAMVTATAEIFREQRNQLAAPPGCKGLRITLAETPSDTGASLDWIVLCHWVLSAGLIGGAAGIWVHASRHRRTWTFVPTSVFWLCLLLGVGIHVTPSLAVALAGATFFSILITVVSLFILMAEAEHPPVPRCLLRNVFVIACVVFGIISIVQRLSEPEYALTTSQVRISVVEPGGKEELPISYDPGFLADETELIRSDFIAGRAVDLALRENEQKWREEWSMSGQREPLEYLRWRMGAECVQGTSVISISYWDEFAKKSQAIAQKTVEVYRDYRQKTEAAFPFEILVTPLGSKTRVERLTGLYGRPWFLKISLAFFGVCFLVGGAVCFSLLAKPLGRAWLIPAGVLGYFLVLGLIWSAGVLGTRSYTAVSTVKPAIHRVSEFDGKNGPSAALERELKTACSDEVLANTASALGAKSEFVALQGEDWPDQIPEQVVWLRKHLRTLSAGGNYLIRFSARAESGKSAALIANAAASCYCALADTGSGTREVLTRATPWVRPDRIGNTLGQSLAGVVYYVVLFSVGAGIAYLGYAWKKSKEDSSSTDAIRLAGR